MSKTQHVIGGMFGLLSLIYLLQNRGPATDGVSQSLKALHGKLQRKETRRISDGRRGDTHRLAVIIPYREAFPELAQLVPSLHAFLNSQHVEHQFVVVHQADNFKFNKGSLINIGFVLSRMHCDYIAIHDVDLVPLNPELKYTYPEKGPYHVVSPEYHPFYHGETYIGGIILLTNEQFEKTKGMTNVYWGWGGEDNEFYMRIIAQNLTIYRPAGLKTGRSNTFKNLHDEKKRPRDKRRFNIERENVFKRDQETGYHNVNYNLDSTTELTISGVPVMMHNVKLICDVTQNKWCT